MSKELYLTGKYGSVIGNYAIVDDEDYDRISKYKWNARKDKNTYYAYSRPDGKGGKHWGLHRYILRLESKLQVDHINGNGLDNQKHNLRICTLGENTRNRRSCKNTTSKFKGVSRTKYGLYLAEIGHNGKRYSLGSYITEEQAAEAYDRKHIELCGEFAKPNFPDKDYSKLDPPTKYCRAKSTGINNISKDKNYYVVNIKLQGIKYNKKFKTLEAAQEYLAIIKANINES